MGNRGIELENNIFVIEGGVLANINYFDSNHRWLLFSFVNNNAPTPGSRPASSRKGNRTEAAARSLHTHFCRTVV